MALAMIEKEIDKTLEKLVTKSKIKQYEKWKREYKDRLFDFIKPIRSKNLPPVITQPPGFETHIICYLFDLLKNKDPHCEWSYRSYVADSRQSADIVFIQPVSNKLFEIWIEVGMFVGDTFQKYSKDFEKVTKVVDLCNWCVGVLVHLESEPRGTVFNLFNSFKDENLKKYSINVRKIGDENSIHIVRLIVRQPLRLIKEPGKGKKSKVTRRTTAKPARLQSTLKGAAKKTPAKKKRAKLTAPESIFTPSTIGNKKRRKLEAYSSIIRSRYDDWEDLQDHIENAPDNRITMSMNKHLLEPHTLDELVEIASKENERLGSNDFITVALVRRHIKWLRARGWIFKKYKNGAYQLVNYKRLD